jgi:proteasome lid subunit RPN8/RPN11
MVALAEQESREHKTEAPSGVRLLGDSASDSDGVEYQSIVRQKVLDLMREHGEETPDVEVCGVLVGTVYQNADAGFVYVEDVIRGHGASGRNSAVTFTAETWSYIDKQMDEHHRGKRIVGWYHTHPGFGIFLSEMDRFIQDHFFNAPWQTAMVYDPQSTEKGMFAWREGKTERVDFVVDDGSGPGGATRVLPAPTTEPGEGTHQDPMPAAPGSAGELGLRLEAIEKRQRHLLIGLAVLAVVAVVWPLVVLMIVPDLRRSTPPADNDPDAKTIVPMLPESPSVPQARDAGSGGSFKAE